MIEAADRVIVGPQISEQQGAELRRRLRAFIKKEWGDDTRSLRHLPPALLWLYALRLAQKDEALRRRLDQLLNEVVCEGGRLRWHGLKHNPEAPMEPWLLAVME